MCLLHNARVKVANPFEDVFLDPLYGEIRLEEAIADLATRPLVQRLRHVRLSNIDSLASPGISNISRYEHALGTAVLAASTSFAEHVDLRLRISFIAAALIHDTGITPFGHLMEEAVSYFRADYHHEKIWSDRLEPGSSNALGGVNLQLYMGFQSGLGEWAEKFFDADANAVIAELSAGIQGGGRFGKGIVGELDLDNLDNVARAAFHMGLPVDRKLPVQIARCLQNVTDSGAVFSDDVVSPAHEWLELREQVYSRFMLPRADFSGKLMLLFAMVEAMKSGALSEKTHRNLTDDQLLGLLSTCEYEDVANATRRWLTGDVWDISDLLWLEGKLPSFSDLNSYATEVSSSLSRHCFAYRIKDKRKRKVELNLASGRTATLGERPTQWLLGVGSSSRKVFTAKENQTIVQIAREHFGAELAIGAEHSSSLFA
jgi:uncharacterized protein